MSATFETQLSPLVGPGSPPQLFTHLSIDYLVYCGMFLCIAS